MPSLSLLPRATLTTTNTNTNMTPQTIAKLRKFFSTLDADLSHDLAFALADRIGTTYEAVVAQYEAWQIA
jgi:hypothetical protein